MNTQEYIKLSAKDIALRVKQGDLKPLEALDCAVERMQEVNPLVNAIVTECQSFGEQYLALMSGNEPYYGVPLVVKDLGFSMQGIRQTDGSRFLQNYLPKENHDFINRALALGFIPFAKSNIPEFGLSYVTESVLFGPCKNPYDLTRTSGGSSGGAAVAVATGIAPVATASDGGGSIRVPAACCGLFGFKPSHGVMPTGPWVEEIWSGMGENFLLARSIEDTVDLFALCAQSFPVVSMEPPFKRTFTFSTVEGCFPDVEVDDACQKAVEIMKDLLNQLGHRVVHHKLPLELDVLGESTLTLIAANTYSTIVQHEKEMNQVAGTQDIEPVARYFYDIGKNLSAADLIHAKSQMYAQLAPLRQLFLTTDFLLTPALAQRPIKIGSLNMDEGFERYVEKNMAFSPFTTLFNQAGLPAMTIPVYHDEVFPISIQLAAQKGWDWQLLQLAQQLGSYLPEIKTITPDTR